MLKHEYGISMLAIAIQLNSLCTKARTKAQCAHSARKGGALRAQTLSNKRILFKQLVYRALSEGYIGESKAAELIGMSLASFHKERKLEVTSDSASSC